MNTEPDQTPYEISTDSARLDVRVIHEFLARSYWSPGIPYAIVERSLRNSLCFGVYQRKQQVGLARVITDRATFAYLADVFVLEPHRGRGLSKRLMEHVIAHPDLQGLRRILLFTSDAHELYRRFGFEELSDPSRVMEIVRRQQSASL
jgi:GNAT superfamily N-acetyltransferase